jgi:signal transduction histidine kinase
MGTMVAGFAHEVRNPVASLRSLAEALNEELIEAKLPMPHVGRMLKVLERVERLVNTSLQFGRPATPKRARHAVWSVLSNASSALSPRTRDAMGALRIDMEPDLPPVFVDEAQLVQILVILLDNAFDAARSPRGVSLRALLHRPESEARARKSQPPPGPPSVRFEVSDDGPGIPEEILGSIFDPFFTTKPAGTGLGLSIAQQLLRENGGRLEVDTQPGGPTTFALIVPVDPPRPRGG